MCTHTPALEFHTFSVYTYACLVQLLYKADMLQLSLFSKDVHIASPARLICSAAVDAQVWQRVGKEKEGRKIK